MSRVIIPFKCLFTLDQDKVLALSKEITGKVNSEQVQGLGFTFPKRSLYVTHVEATGYKPTDMIVSVYINYVPHENWDTTFIRMDGSTFVEKLYEETDMWFLHEWEWILGVVVTYGD